jgi:thiol-disulfide isomerase/thioredoxin
MTRDSAILLAFVVLSACVAVEGFILIGLMRQMGSVLLQITPFPGLVDGGPEAGVLVDLPSDLETRPLWRLVVFLSPGCGPCEELLPSVKAAARAYSDMDVIAAVTGEKSVERDAFAQRLPGLARLDMTAQFDDWKVPGTPYAVLVDENSHVAASAVVNSLDQLEVLVAAGKQSPHQTSGIDHGEIPLMSSRLGSDVAARDLATTRRKRDGSASFAEADGG